MGGAIILLAVLFGGAVIAVLSRVLFAGSITFLRSKTKTVSAVVLSKRKKDMYRPSGIYTNYFILFQLGENDKMELPVNKKLYKADNIGKRGVLTYKGDIFIKFVLDKDLPKENPKKETYILNGQVIEK